MKSGYRVLACGTREGISDTVLDTELTRLAPDVVIEGGCTGVDQQAAVWAWAHDVELVTSPANWRRSGQAAGPIRNQVMAVDGRPDLVLAFPMAISKGTNDMIQRAERAGAPVRVVDVLAGTGPKRSPYEQRTTKEAVPCVEP